MAVPLRSLFQDEMTWSEAGVGGGAGEGEEYHFSDRRLLSGDTEWGDSISPPAHIHCKYARTHSHSQYVKG